MSRNIKVLVVAVMLMFAVSFLLYCVTAPIKDAHYDLDSYGYDRIANHYAKKGQLIDPQRGAIIPIQTLGYPFFLGCIYRYIGADITYVIALQVLINSAIGIILFYCALLLFNWYAAVITAFLWALNGGYLIFCHFIMTDLLLAFLLLLAAYWVLRFYKEKNSVWLGYAGIVYGISCVVKPVALFFMLIVLCSILACYADDIKKGLQQCLHISAWFSSCVIGYMFLNYMLFNTFTLAPLLQENIYHYFLARVTAHAENISYQEAFTETQKLFEHKLHDDPTRWDKSKEKLWHYCTHKPLTVLFVWMHNVVKTLGGLYINQVKYLHNPALKGTATSFFEEQGSVLEKLYRYLTHGVLDSAVQFLIIFFALYSIVQFLLVALAIPLLWEEKRFFILFFFLATIIYFSFITGHEGCARYRLMFESTFILLASYSITRVMDMVRKYSYIIGI